MVLILTLPLNNWGKCCDIDNGNETMVHDNGRDNNADDDDDNDNHHDKNNENDNNDNDDGHGNHEDQQS